MDFGSLDLSDTSSSGRYLGRAQALDLQDYGVVEIDYSPTLGQLDPDQGQLLSRAHEHRGEELPGAAKRRELLGNR